MTSVYKKVEDIVPGDLVAWWTRFALVISNDSILDIFALTVYDPFVQKESCFKYSRNDELLVHSKG